MPPQQSYTYDAFGNMLTQPYPNSNRQFLTKEADPTGFVYFGLRYYDPELGRFTQPDTIIPSPFDPQAFNRYSYARNNPIRYTDPTGHSWFSKLWDKVEDFFKIM